MTKFLNRLLQGDTWDVRFLMTLLTLSRGLKGTRKPNLGTIIASPTHGDITTLNVEIGAMAARLFPRIQPVWTKPHVTSKAGPNGQAIDSSIIDLFALTDRLRREIFEVGGTNLEEYMVK
jgi:hypothetical protein